MLIKQFLGVRYILATSAQIRAARALLGWKQTDLAEHSGISVPSIKNVERGATDPRMSTIEAIQRAFEMAGVEFSEHGVKAKAATHE